MKLISGKLTYANVMATVAVFIALGGASYAAIKVPKNSVGTKQLKNGAVTADKVKNGAITGQKIASQTLGTVPSATKATAAETATNAAHATTADTATNATNAANAKTLDGLPPSSFATPDLVRTATVSATGVLKPELSVGVTQANVIHKETGTYCINGLSPAPKTALATPTFGGQLDSDIVARVENQPDCQTVVVVFGPGPSRNPTDEPFTVLLR